MVSPPPALVPSILCRLPRDGAEGSTSLLCSAGIPPRPTQGKPLAEKWVGRAGRGGGRGGCQRYGGGRASRPFWSCAGSLGLGGRLRTLSCCLLRDTLANTSALHTPPHSVPAFASCLCLLSFHGLQGEEKSLPYLDT